MTIAPDRPMSARADDLRSNLERPPRFGFDAVEPRPTPANRREANRRAVALSLELEREGRPPSPEERLALAAYTGHGGVDDANRDIAGNTNALASLNEYYTPTGVALAMWALLVRAGLPDGARVLEPSAGPGVFLEVAPPGVSVLAVELSEESARINRLLHPEHEVVVSGFEDFNRSSRTFDLDGCIGNPPYGTRGARVVLDKPWVKDYAEYFFEACFDRVKPGGLVCLLVNSGLLEGEAHAAFRARLLARARLVTAVRLPLTTFEHSDSLANPDVVLLEKRAWTVGETLAELAEKYGPRALAAAGLIDEATRDALKGCFFQSRPDHCLGVLARSPRWNQVACEGTLDAAALERLALAPLLETRRGPATLGGLKERLEGSERFRALAAERSTTPEGAVKAAWAASRKRGYPFSEGAPSTDHAERFAYRLEAGRWWRGWEAVARGHSSAATSALAVAERLERHAEARAGSDGGRAEGARLEALAALTAHLASHGNPRLDPSLLALAAERPSLYRLVGSVDEAGRVAPALAEPAAEERLKGDDPHEVARILARRGGLTVEALARACPTLGRGGTRDLLVEGEDYALTPDGTFLPWGEYERGNLVELADLAAAQAAEEPDLERRAKLERQAERLRSLKPKRPLEEVEVRGSEGWIPTPLLQRWLDATSGRLTVERDHKTGRVTVTPGEYRLERPSNQWRSVTVERREAKDARESADELTRFLNLEHKASPVQGRKDLTPEEYAAARAARIEEAREREDAVAERFKAWACSDLEAREELEDLYHRLYASSSSEALDESPLGLPGWAGPRPHGYQNAGVRFVQGRGNALIAFDTGLGKTFTGLATTELMLEEGRARRALITVPKGLLSNWLKWARIAMPWRRVVAVGATADAEGALRDDEPREAMAKLAALAGGAHELCLITRDWLRRLEVRQSRVLEFIADEAILQAGEDPDDLDDEEGGLSRKQRKSIAEREADLVSRIRPHNAVPGLYFEDLGVDALIVDEAGSLKNLFAAPPIYGEKPKFMGASGEADRSLDTLLKALITQQLSGGRNTVLMTATPTKNSPLELYNLLRFVAGRELVRLGLFGPRQFVERYCELDTVLVPDSSGEIKATVGVTGFKNLGELRALINRFVLFRTAADVGLKIPELETREVVFPMTPGQRDRYEGLRRAAATATTQGKGSKARPHLFSVFGKMRLLTLEPSLLSGKDEPNPRFEAAAEIAVSALREGGKCVAFMDVGAPGEEGLDGKKTGKRKPGPDAFDRLKQHLVRAGIPEHEVAVVTADRVKGPRRQEIAEAYNRSEYKVVVGSTASIGEGFDLQVGTSDLIHLDVPWDPGTMHQRIGRGHRQGNHAEVVRNHVLLAQGSFDGLTFSTLLGKRGWQHQLWKGDDDRGDNSAGLSYDDVLAALSDDPDTRRREVEAKRADIEKRKLAERAKSAWRLYLTYAETLRSRLEAWRKAQGRKHGPTDRDRQLQRHLLEQAERYRARLRADPAFGQPHLLEGDVPPLVLGDGERVFAPGQSFRLEWGEAEHAWLVLEVRHDYSGNPRVVASSPTFDNGRSITFDEARLGPATDVRAADALELGRLAPDSPTEEAGSWEAQAGPILARLKGWYGANAPQGEGEVGEEVRLEAAD